jgi:hypothetical protein
MPDRETLSGKWRALLAGADGRHQSRRELPIELIKPQTQVANENENENALRSSAQPADATP